MSRQNDRFYNLFALILGVLVLVTVGILALANQIHAKTQGAFIEQSAEKQAEVIKHIQPFATVAVQTNQAAVEPKTNEASVMQAATDMPIKPAPAAMPLATASLPPASKVALPTDEPAPAPRSGKMVYQQACATCHASGLLQAPKLGSTEDWAPRLAKGKNALYENAIKGINTMPAKGGRSDLSDDEVKQSVDFMLNQL